MNSWLLQKLSSTEDENLRAKYRALHDYIESLPDHRRDVAWEYQYSLELNAGNTPEDRLKYIIKELSECSSKLAETASGVVADLAIKKAMLK